MYQISSGFNISDNDKKIVEFWQNKEIYKKIVEMNKNGPKFNFMDGPPFVTGDLHYGHLLIGGSKALILTYYQMLGYNVSNKMGYDCHGLPIEMLVNKELKINTRKEIEELGIKNYNAKCKELIYGFSNSWKNVYDRIGRLVDWSDQYKTMDTDFMETSWWVFKQLWDKGLIYRGYKIMPYSTACTTPLSNFEAGQNHKEVDDKSLYVKFKVKNESNTFLIAWTTTPWTLPSNLALCVNPKIEYVKIKPNDFDNEIFILAKNCLDNLYKPPRKRKKNYKNPYVILESFLGEDLKDTEYEPLFNYFDEKDRKFVVLCDEFVDDSSGCGVVHCAPAFGEDDMKVCIKNNIVSIEDIGLYCPLDDSGKFTKSVSDYQGLLFKDANEKIINRLKLEKKIVKQEMIRHRYPFCWRTDTPLIYRAISSFFVKVTTIKDDLIENNKKIKWSPDFVGKNRFGNWLESARDWGISRNRFFGTPIPVWVSDDGEEMVCIGSINELVKLAGLKERPNDLHREFIDKIEIPSKMGKGMLKCTGEVLDCWFESGSVPYGQKHYPFEKSDIFEEVEYISDFICEGIDQTRGWFYTLNVLSTALFNKPAFRNCVCAGLILAEDGKKMSKRLKNYPEPLDILNKYGADALRLYLSSSTAIRAEAFRFKEHDISTIFKKLYQLLNGYKFFAEYCIKFEKYGNKFDPLSFKKTENVMDRWILSRIGTYSTKISEHIESRKLHKIQQEVLDLIEDLTNWYIKFNRSRLNGKLGKDNQSIALSTLGYIYLTLCRSSASFLPFLSETIYQKLKLIYGNYLGSYSISNVKLVESVEIPISVLHLSFPKIPDFPIDSVIERKMSRLQKVACMIRSLRSKNPKWSSSKKPLKSISVCDDNLEIKEDIKELELYLKNEINVINVEYKTIKGLVNYKALPNHKNIGKQFGQESKQIKSYLNELNSKILSAFYNKDKYTLEFTDNDKEFKLNETHFEVKIDSVKLDSDHQSYLIKDSTLVIVDFQETEEIQLVYLSNLFVRTVQDLRKNTNLRPWDNIEIHYKSSDKLKSAIDLNKKHVSEKLGKPVFYTDNVDDYLKNKVNTHFDIIITEKCSIEDYDIEITILQLYD